MRKLQIIKRTKVWHNPGDIVEVSPDDADFLTAVGAAVPVLDNAQEEQHEPVQEPARATGKTKKTKK